MVMRSRAEITAAKKQAVKPVEPKTEVCPACNLEQPAGNDECARCSESFKAGVRDVSQDTAGEKAARAANQTNTPRGASDVEPPQPHTQENISRLTAALCKRGITATLDCVAALQPGQRNSLAAFAIDGTLKADQVMTSLEALERQVAARTAASRQEALRADDGAKAHRITPAEQAQARTAIAGVSPGPVPTGEKAGARDEVFTGRREEFEAGVAVLTNDTVSYTFGEEVYQVEPYCTFRVGPFTLSRPRRAGESRVDVLVELAGDAERFADGERERKSRGYTGALRVFRGEDR